MPTPFAPAAAPPPGQTAYHRLPLEKRRDRIVQLYVDEYRCAPGAQAKIARLLGIAESTVARALEARGLVKGEVADTTEAQADAEAVAISRATWALDALASDAQRARVVARLAARYGTRRAKSAKAATAA